MFNFIFKKDINSYRLDTVGFQEKIIEININQFNHIAHATVIFEVRIPGTSYPVRQGLDSFHLVKQGNRWYILSILNNYPQKDQIIPKKL